MTSGLTTQTLSYRSTAISNVSGDWVISVIYLSPLITALSIREVINWAISRRVQPATNM